MNTGSHPGTRRGRLSTTPVRGVVAGVTVAVAMMLGTLGFAESSSAASYPTVGTPAPCWVNWPSSGVPSSSRIGCSPSSYMGSDFKVQTKTSSNVGINTYGRVRSYGFIICSKRWGSQCKFSGSANI